MRPQFMPLQLMIMRSLLRFLFALGITLSFCVQAQDSDVLDANTVTNQDPLPLEDLRLFTMIFEHVRRSYVEPVSDQELLEKAIKGMLQELDPHSNYLDSDHFSAIKETTKGEFGGVGLEIGIEDGYVKVITPIDDSPAANAGLQTGDMIIKLDNESIRGLSLTEAAKKMRGPKGTVITFTIIRQGVNKPFDVKIIRDTIKTLSVRSRMIEQDYGYVRISQFQSNTGKDFIDSISMMRENHPNLKGLVLDLRNNPGGVLQASVEVVDALINDGLIVYTKGRLDNSNQSFEATTGDVSDGLPLVVLINDGSASAAEIVAGALQDHKRAIIMGTTSFGKGSVQTILPVAKDKGIKLTTALYFTPTGRSIQAQGIVPDIEIRRATITEVEEVRQFKEANLSGHLSNNHNGDETNAVDEKDSYEDSENIVKDNQLYEAINMLRGLAIFNQRN